MPTRPALSAAILASALLVPSGAGAAGVEITGFAGYTFPFYKQTFAYDPGPINIPIPGVSIEQGGQFELKASGGVAYGGAIGLFATDTFGFEFRLDRAEVNVKTQSSVFDVRVTLPQPLDPVSSTLTLGEGEATAKAPLPWSINLKVRGGGATHVFASGGLSRLGSLEATLEQPIAIGVSSVDLDSSVLKIPTVTVRARATDTTKSWGGNLGLGVQIGIGERGGLVLEARGFYFPKRTIPWDAVSVDGLTSLEQELLGRTLDALPAVEFEPWWVQATVGFSFRF